MKRRMDNQIEYFSREAPKSELFVTEKRTLAKKEVKTLYALIDLIKQANSENLEFTAQTEQAGFSISVCTKRELLAFELPPYPSRGL